MSIPAQQTASGAGMGALSGAATGAAAGSFVPVIGNLIGAAIGAAVGGLAGGLGGNAQGRLADTAQKQRASQNLISASHGEAPNLKPPGETPSSAISMGSPIVSKDEGQAYSPEMLAALRGNQMLTQSAGGAAEQPMYLPPETTYGGLANEEATGLHSLNATMSEGPSMGGILKAIGLDDPKTAVSALVGGANYLQRERAIAASARQGPAAYAIAPGIHAAAAVPVKFGGGVARKLSPLEEFAMLMKGF